MRPCPIRPAKQFRNRKGKSRSGKPPEDQARIGPAEAKGIRQSKFQLRVSGLLHEVEFGQGFGLLYRSRWRKPLLAQGHEANDRFDCTCSAQEMANAGFG